ncbi:hypothetical protein R3P38DRAFT_2573191 [Favolaschia claudopus]|uniref:Uncharacterized protein n=1 Tax=Favolaschia claudopus TaxID=2862362 RepID=A0AAV9ZPT5_9AGAR
MATGSRKAPWGAMATASGARELVTSSSLPSNFGLQDPSRMVKEEASKIYKHWEARQKAGKDPLTFKVAEAKKKQEEDQRTRLQNLKRKKSGYTENDDDDDDGAEVEHAGRNARKGKGKEKEREKPPQNKKTKTPEPMPSWVTWDKVVGVNPGFFATQGPHSWKGVVQWMSTNPHIPRNEDALSHIQASEILLAVGLAHQMGKQSAEADPGSPLYDLPFNISDLDIIEAGIKSMLIQAKALRKFGVGQNIHRAIEGGWKKICLEVGLAEYDIVELGQDWQAFAEAYATLDSALIRSGKPSQHSALEIFPDQIQNWVRASDGDGNRPRNDKTNWGDEMTQLWNATKPKAVAAEAGNLDGILDEDWCRRGRGGIVCIVLGMKWWGLSLLASEDQEQLLEAWSDVVLEMTASFKVIGGAPSL